MLASRKTAFSLLETLVSMSLLLLLMTLILTMSAHLTKLWHRLEHQQESCSEGRALLQMMTNDLRSAVLLPHTLLTNIPTTNPTCRKNIFFLIKESSPHGSGDIFAAGYFLAPEKKPATTYQCYRFSASSEETLQALKVDTLSTLCSRASPENTTHCEPVASNITSWKIIPAWASHGHVLQHPLLKSDQQSPLPSLIELSITAGSDFHHEAIMLSTVVTLPQQ